MEQVRNQNRITGIQLFQFDVPSCYRYGEGLLTDCHYGLLKMTCGDHTGWSECIMSANDAKHFDLVQWSSFLQLLKKPTLPEAFETMNFHREIWGETKTELIRIALLDLAARVQSKKLIELLPAGQKVPVAAGSGVRTPIRSDQVHIHPGSHRTLLETINEAQSLREQGFKLLIHKDYLIGPGCSAMRLVSDSLGAQWVEADEYPEPEPLRTRRDTSYGTGFQLDMNTLIKKCHAYYAVL
jgi:hypothetical protein